MSAFNSWMAITNATLDDSTPLLPQLQKLNDLHITLSNNDNKITNLQYCFMLLKALLESYSTIVLTILVSGEPTDLTLQKIQDWILNEEG